MKYLLLSFLLYFQNLIFSLFSPFIFIPNPIEFILILLIIILLSKIKYFKPLILIWQALYVIHFSFISYFGSNVTSTDIYLFFTHITETFETLANMYQIIFIPAAIAMPIIFVIIKLNITKSTINNKLLILLIALCIYYLPAKQPYDASFAIIRESIDYFTKKPPIEHTVIKKEINTIPLKQKDINIILVLGESMRAKEYQQNNYSIFLKNHYKTIYSAATNTDVSIPMLINGADSPLNINFRQNLFRLAKKNDFTTSFITVQSSKSMKYIMPYLDTSSIDRLNIIGSRDDGSLADSIKNINFNDKNFLVMQMQGEHSPYIYFPKEYGVSDDPIANYNKSMIYSDKILREMISYIKVYSKKPTLFIFTSDHGQLIGTRGKFGHNRFEEEIYKVPLVIYEKESGINKEDISQINNHHDVYRLLHFTLGYSPKLNLSNDAKIKIYGTMITAEDGFIEILK